MDFVVMESVAKPNEQAGAEAISGGQDLLALQAVVPEQPAPVSSATYEANDRLVSWGELP